MCYETVGATWRNEVTGTPGSQKRVGGSSLFFSFISDSRFRLDPTCYASPRSERG